MKGVLLTVAYDGSQFVGWARQKSGRSVEETLQQAIRKIDPDSSSPRGASRTDAGVHADGQRAAFDTTRTIDPRGWVLALNSNLLDDVRDLNRRHRTWRIPWTLDLEKMRREAKLLEGTHDFVVFRTSSDERK